MPPGLAPYFRLALQSYRMEKAFARENKTNSAHSQQRVNGMSQNERE